MSQMSGNETPNNPTGSQQSSDATQNEQPTAFKSMDTGSATSNESSRGEEGLTTSRVNHTAADDSGSDADESREHSASRTDAGNRSELDTREDAGNGAGADAGRPPLRNGDTGYSS